jgi:hypothetical protein
MYRKLGEIRRDLIKEKTNEKMTFGKESTKSETIGQNELPLNDGADAPSDVFCAIPATCGVRN